MAKVWIVLEDTNKGTEVELHCSMNHGTRPKATNVTELVTAISEAVYDINHKEEF